MNSVSQSLNLSIAWEKYLRFETCSREKDDDLSNFISEWEEKRVEAQSVGCHYSDLVLALKLVEKVNLDLDSTQYIFSKLGSSGRQRLLPEIIAEIKNQEFARSKEETPWPNEDIKLDQQPILKDSFQDEMSAFQNFTNSNEIDAKIEQEEDVKLQEIEDSSDQSQDVSSCHFGCGQCSLVFKSRRKWEKHLKLHTNRFQCSKCEKCFLTKNVLKVHVRRCQPGVTLNLDDLEMEDKAVKKEHPLDIFDDEVRISPCEICGRLLKETSMKTHVKSHYHKFECKICHKKFANQTYLKTHIRLHTSQERDFVCTFCGKGFKTKDVLNGHMNIHTKAKSFICVWCGQKFFNSNSWKLHVRSQHTGENCHQCDVCQKKFFTATKLRYHMRTHTGEKPYKCEYCGKSFGDCTTYKRHIRRIHSKLNELPSVQSVEEVRYEYVQ